MKTKRVVALFLTAAMTFSLAACGGSGSTTTASATEAKSEASTEAASQAGNAATASEEKNDAENGSTAEGKAPEITSTDKVSIIWSHNAAEETSGHKIAVMFKERVEELSGGNITVDIYPNGQMGTVPENDQALRDGTIQIISGTSGSTTDLALSYFDAPNLVLSMEDALKVFGRGTDLRQVTEGIYEGIGMKVLSFMPGGFRETSSNVKVTNFEELKGLNIRTMENPVSMEYWKDWGCNPTPIAFSELYIALQQGLVDAEENMYDTILASKLYEQQKYIINTHHVMMWNGVYMNLEFYNSLPADYQALISYVWESELDQKIYDMSLEANEEALQTMKDAGLEVIDFSTEDLQKMREAAAPAYAMIRESVGDEIMDQVEAALGMN